MADDEQPEEEEEIKSVTLKVKLSKIATGGRARIHCDVMAELMGVQHCHEVSEDEVEEKGELIVVANGDDRILVRAFHDTMIDPGEISLREPDAKKLDVKAGGEVEVYLHRTLRQATREGWGDAKEKWGAWLEKVKDKFKKTDEEEEADEE